MNNHISETNLSDTVDENNNNILTLDLLGKAKEIIVGLKPNDVKFNKKLQEILGENPNDDHPELVKIIDNLKSNIFVRKKSNLEDDFLSSGTMQLNGSSDLIN